jgi:D-sedoheptulose 7-phosphate isomerase
MDLRASILRKARESAAVKEEFFANDADRIAECAKQMAAAFDGGARLFAMGNGGSACDAEHVAVEFMHPVFEKRPALPASVVGDPRLVSAVGNDRDFSLAYATELRLHARRGDIALGISTSGKSSSVTRALQAAREIGMLTIAFTGRDGGKLPALAEHCFVVPSFSVHRIQETHETLLHVLWDLVHVVRGEEDVVG